MDKQKNRRIVPTSLPSFPPVPASAEPTAGIAVLVLFLIPLCFAVSLTGSFELVQGSCLLLGLLIAVTVCGVELLRVRWRSVIADPLHLGLLLLLLSATLSTILSTRPIRAFFGVGGSHAGWLMIASLVGVYALVRRARSSPTCGDALIVAGGVTSCYAFFQVLGLDPVRWSEESRVGDWVRPVGTLGHANHLATFLVPLLPLTLMRAWEVHSARRRFAAGLLVALVLLEGALLGLTLSRSGWLGGAAALGTLGLFVGLKTTGRARTYFWILCAAAVVGGVLLIVLHSGVRLRITNAFDSPGRRITWSVAWAVFCEHPLFGVGPDHLGPAFAARQPSEFWHVEWGAVALRAHMLPLHIAVTQGLVGVAALVLIVLGTVRRAWSAWERGDARSWALVAGLVGVMCVCQFHFLVIGTGVPVFAYLAMLRTEGEDERSAEGFPNGLVLLGTIGVGGIGVVNFLDPHHSVYGTGRILIGLMPLTAWGLFVLLQGGPTPLSWPRLRFNRGFRMRSVPASVAAFVLALEPMRAARLEERALLASAANPQEAIALYAAAARATPWNEQLAIRRGTLWELLAEQAVTAEDKLRCVEAALEDYRQAYRWAPNLGTVSLHLGRAEAEAARLRGRPATEALAHLEEALRREPANAQFLTEASRSALRVQAFEQALRWARDGIEQYPTCAALLVQEAQYWMARGEYARAHARFFAATQADWHGDAVAWERAHFLWGRMLLRLGRPEDALWVSRFGSREHRDRPLLRQLEREALRAVRSSEEAAEPPAVGIRPRSTP